MVFDPFKHLSNITLLFGLLVISIFISSCREKNDKESWGKVQYAGALKNIMHKGDLSTKISLNELKEKENLYALGAMTDLKGEIQIFDGTVFNSQVIGDSLVIENSFNNSATLLVYTQVKSWDSIGIPSTVVLRKDLEKFIMQEAKRNGINIRKPFPFLLEGIFNTIDWHVINWPEGDKEHSHEKHIKSGLHGTFHNAAANMLGFYSEKHKGIFTHHTSDTHIHFKTEAEKISGHVDDLIISKNIVLKLPSKNPSR